MFTFILLFACSFLEADSFKLMGGLNLIKYSSFPSTRNADWRLNIGLCVGAGIEFDLTENKRLAIEIDGMMIQKKGTLTIDPSRPDLNTDYNLSTISVPALAKIKPITGIPFYFFGGGVGSLVLSHKYSTNKNQKDLKEDTKTVDFGFVAGIGYEAKINFFQNIFIEARYQRGFLNLLRFPKDDESLKSHALLIIVGIKTD